jgi:hypothetical protein
MWSIGRKKIMLKGLLTMSLSMALYALSIYITDKHFF